jgi:hypothetical protein
MSLFQRVSLAALLSLTVAVGMAQDSKLTDWLAVPPEQTGIVLAIDFPVYGADVSSEGKILASKKWIGKEPFVWQLRLKPDDYQIQFKSGPIWSVGVVAKRPGALTYVRVFPIKGSDGTVGVGVAVTAGPPPVEVTNWLQNAAQIGGSDALRVDYIEPGNRVLLVSTEPPWAIPPPPPPKR